MKLRDAIKNKPRDATHWDGRRYYFKSNSGIWFMFDDTAFLGLDEQLDVDSLIELPAKRPDIVYESINDKIELLNFVKISHFNLVLTIILASMIGFILGTNV